MSIEVDFLIAGGGLAGASCVEAIRKENSTSSVTIICRENHLPYHRPPLSKGLLLGYEQPENVFVRGDDYYAENKVDVRLGVSITAVDPEGKTAADDQGNEYHYGKLLIATGSELRHLGVPGDELENVFYLRTLDHSLAISKEMDDAKASPNHDKARAVVIGAGFIGMELASALAQKEIHTTMLVRDKKLFSRLESPEISDFFLKYYQDKGVEVIFGDSATHFEGDGKVSKVVTAGGRALPCDLVYVGIGVTPDVAFLNGCGLDIDPGGIVVDEYLRSSDPDIYTAGDVSHFYDPIYERRRHIEHWDNAIKQGQLAGRNMLGAEQPYDMISYFYSDLFDLSWEFLGDNHGSDETLIRGSFEEGAGIAFYLKENRLLAAFLLMQTPAERKAVEELIKKRTDMSALKEKLTDEAADLQSLG